MGRIAEALKKAQQDRLTRLRIGAAVKTADPPLESEAPGAASRREVAGQMPRWFAKVLPVTGLPEEPAASSRRTAASARRIAQPLAPLPAWDVHPAVVAVHERSSSIAEQYRAIRTWLLRRGPTSERACLALTSSIQGEGKSVTTANLAVTLAEVRHLRVLAVDADFRQGMLAKLLRVPNVPGLGDVLAGRVALQDAILPTPLSNLWVLPAGACQGLNPTELLNSPAAARVFDEIRERHHFILVDTPPVQKLSDAAVVGALCTGILMVVRMHKTPNHLVRQSVHWLQSNNLQVVGCIAAACNLRDARHLYRENERLE